MTQPNINLQPSEYNLADLLALVKKQIKLEMNCHHIGTIQLFDPLTQTAQATINYAKTFLALDDVGNTSITTQNYPVILDCPCIVLGGGGGALTFPITSGDECLVLFNDRDIDNWFTGSASSAPATGRLHSFTDALILVGLRSLSNVLVDYDTDAVTLSYLGNKVSVLADSVVATLAGGASSLELSADSVTANLSDGEVSLELSAEGTIAVTNPTGELIASLVQLFTDVSTATAGGFPVLMPTFPTDILVLESFMG